MASAIGSSTLSSYAGGGQSFGGLQAQLDRYQRQLADWVHCPSCKTPEGKAKIADLSDKIGAIQQRLKAADAAQRKPANAGAGAATGNSGASAGGAAAPAQASPPVGAGLNVFA